MASKTVTCACGSKVTHADNFAAVHAGACTLMGKVALDSKCPECAGPMEWTAGKYSTFRACAAGVYRKRGQCKGKLAAPRGLAAAMAKEKGAEVSDAPEAEEGPDAGEIASAGKAQSAAGEALYQLLADTIRAEIDQRARTIAQEIVAAAPKAGPSEITFVIDSKVIAKVEGRAHAQLPRLIKLASAGFKNFLIVGPAGSGKTTLAADLAKALSLKFASVSCSGGMSESALTGRLIPNLTTGKTDFQSTQFVDVYETGGVFLIDEADAADANVMITINSALANGHMPLPNRVENPSATRHADTYIVAAANTFGMGADRQYVGRNQLDAAFLDRFVGATIPVDYDRDLEGSLVTDAKILARVWGIREKVATLKIRRVVGTRFLLASARLCAAGETLDQALTACAEGWTPDERTKAGI